MSRIVREMLDFARRQPASAEQTSIDLADVARHATRLLHAIARKNGVDLVLEAPAPVVVHGNFGHLEQALTNLIVNGIHAMPDGGRLEVRVGADGEADPKKGAMAFVSVTDQGTGIPDGDMPKLFDTFFTTKPAGQGTGLGLPVALGIAEDHRGTISVTSQVGKGSTFKLLLPKAA
jgi:signal transduction histidine kinase